MADQPEDLGIPMRPTRPAVSTPIPSRVSNPTSPTSEVPIGTQKPTNEPAQPRTMVVGQGISLSGHIRSCNRLLVEGSLEATLHDCGQMEIAETGYFKGNASIKRGEISGEFDGELIVSERLLIRASGHVSGTVTYGEIEIERGGKITGTIQSSQGATTLPASLVRHVGE